MSTSTITEERPPKSRRRPSATRKLFDPEITTQAIKDSFTKLDPVTRSATLSCSGRGRPVLTTVLFLRSSFVDSR
jgi:hypothetical protein